MKQESQRRVRSVRAGRSLTSSTVVQKQVGQTMVQLPQVRQRAATSSQRLCSRLPSSRSCRSSARICRPMLAAVRATTAGGAVDVRRRRRAMRQARQQSRRRGRCRLPAGIRAARPAISVSARSKPASTFGPVFIEAQKQVPPAWPQFTATMKTPSRRAW